MLKLLPLLLILVGCEIREAKTCKQAFEENTEQTAILKSEEKLYDSFTSTYRKGDVVTIVNGNNKGQKGKIVDVRKYIAACYEKPYVIKSIVTLEQADKDDDLRSFNDASFLLSDVK